MSLHNCLMIEDSRTQSKILSGFIAKHDWMATICFSVEDALRSYQNIPFEGILLDLFLEKGMSLKHLAEIRRSWSGTPITVMTAGSDQIESIDALKAARRAGVEFVIKKPFPDTVLGDILKDKYALKTTGRRRLHVLVVDDSRTVLKFAEHAVKSTANFRVSTAASMEEALDRLTYDTVDVVCTDIFMPGMGGIEGIQRIRASYPHVSVVAMSGGLEENMDGSKALTAASKIGADACIMKPFQPQGFCDVIERAARMSGYADMLEPCSKAA